MNYLARIKWPVLSDKKIVTLLGYIYKLVQEERKDIELGQADSANNINHKYVIFNTVIRRARYAGKRQKQTEGQK